MPVYIARDYNRRVVDVVLATDKRIANAFWQGKGIYYHSVDEVTEENLKTESFPVWGSQYQIVGTVDKITASGEIQVLWDNGAKQRYPLHTIEIYNEKKHDKYKEPSEDPNKSFIIAKRRGNIK